MMIYSSNGRASSFNVNASLADAVLYIKKKLSIDAIQSPAFSPAFFLKPENFSQRLRVCENICDAVR
jgi:hypothetical protein